VFPNANPGCGCTGKANCACEPEVKEEPLPVKHKHAYKKKPQFKTVLTSVNYEELEKKVEMRPVEEIFTKTVMVDKTVEQPRVVMHTMTRTREVPEIRQRTVSQLQTTCK